MEVLGDVEVMTRVAIVIVTCRPGLFFNIHSTGKCIHVTRPVIMWTVILKVLVEPTILYQ